MLTTLDDYLVHQVVDTVDHVGTSDPNFYDRYWFELGDIEGELLICVGLAVYPNRQVMDAFANVTVDDCVQHNIRVSRDMRTGIPDRAQTTVGPISVQVMQGLRQLRVAIAPNRSGISCDIVFDAPQDPFERPIDFTRYRGRIVNNTCHYNQAGHLSGTASVGGRHWKVTPGRWYGVRDHSWGVRGAGDPAQQPEPRPTGGGWFNDPGGAVWQWMATQWPDHYTYWHRLDVGTETPRGTWGEVIYPEKRPHMAIADARVTGVQYAEQFGLHRMKRAEFEFTTADGRARQVSVDHISTNYLRGGGYGGYRDFHHGAYRGEYFEEGETWRFDNRGDMEDAAGFAIVDHFARFESEGQVGYGIFEFSDDPARRWYQRHMPEAILPA